MEWFTGKTVVVTGGSTGIGAAMAKRLAMAGSRLVLVARSARRLEEVAERLRREHQSQVEALPMDLTRPGAGSALAREVERLGRPVDVLVNNAGFASYGRFREQALEPQLEEVQLNVAALVESTWAFLPQLVERRGGLLQVASTAAFQPVPYMAVYGATKAFVLSFTEALWAEYRSSGLRVTALCPGATETPFFDRVGAEEAAVGARATPDEVAKVGLEALVQGRPLVVQGASNVLGTLAPRFVTRARAALIVERMMRPRRPAELAPGASR